MHRNRNNGTWQELKAKRNNKFYDAPLESVGLMHSYLDGESNGIQKVKKDRTVKQQAEVQNMSNDMANYTDKKD